MTGRGLCISLLIGMVWGCSGAEPAKVSTHQNAITAGQQSEEYPAVGPLLGDLGNGWDMFACTATVIGQRTLLTAAHCVKGKWPIYFYVGDMDGRQYIAESAAMHPQYQGGNVADLAVIRLTEAVVGVTPMPLAQQQPRLSELVTLVGFGKKHETGDYGVKRFAQNKIGRVNAQTFSIYGSSGGYGNVCDGDSGGPSLALRNGLEVIVGVHSTKAGACGTTGHDMRVDVFIPWIKAMSAGDLYGQDTVQVAPAHGAGGFGDYCWSSEQCGSKLCILSEENAYCSKTCEENVECPLDYRCADGTCRPVAQPSTPCLRLDNGTLLCTDFETLSIGGDSRPPWAPAGCSLAASSNSKDPNDFTVAFALLLLAVMGRRRFSDQMN
jgi:hypothetical protein